MDTRSTLAIAMVIVGAASGVSIVTTAMGRSDPWASTAVSYLNARLDPKTGLPVKAKQPAPDPLSASIRQALGCRAAEASR